MNLFRKKTPAAAPDRAAQLSAELGLVKLELQPEWLEAGAEIKKTRAALAEAERIMATPDKTPRECAELAVAGKEVPVPVDRQALRYRIDALTSVLVRLTDRQLLIVRRTIEKRESARLDPLVRPYVDRLAAAAVEFMEALADVSAIRHAIQGRHGLAIPPCMHGVPLRATDCDSERWADWLKDRGAPKPAPQAVTVRPTPKPPTPKPAKRTAAPVDPNAGEMSSED